MNLFQRAVKVQAISNLNKEELKYVIDVRTPAEFKAGNVAGSVNIPLEKLVKTPEKFINKDKEYYVICRSGARSSRTVSALKRQGYTNLINVKGGYLAYERIQNN